MKADTRKKIELRNDGYETYRFLAFAKQVISVPKAEIDRRLAEQKQAKEMADKKTAK